MSDKNGIAQVDKPVQLTWRNRRVKTRENTNGEFFCLIEFEFDEEAWGFLKTIPRNANGEMVIWVTEVGIGTQKPKKEKKQPGEYGHLWKNLHLSGFFNVPGIRESLEEVRENEHEDAHLLMRKVFGVDSLSRAIGPDEIYNKFPPNEYPAVKTMVEQALRKVEIQ